MIFDRRLLCWIMLVVSKTDTMMFERESRVPSICKREYWYVRISNFYRLSRVWQVVRIECIRPETTSSGELDARAAPPAATNWHVWQIIIQVLFKYSLCYTIITRWLRSEPVRQKPSWTSEIRDWNLGNCDSVSGPHAERQVQCVGTVLLQIQKSDTNWNRWLLFYINA